MLVRPIPPPSRGEGGNSAFYHLYVDFNKAFNSVPRTALRRALEGYGLPDWIIKSIFLLYTEPNDFPLVNGHTPSFYHLDRGLMQGCPMSPILFNLYLGLALFSLPVFTGTSFSFIDDILFRVADPLSAKKIFCYFDTVVRELGLDMNSEKTEIQAMGDAAHFSFRARGGMVISTCRPDGTPRDFYRYLGVYLYSSDPGGRLDTYVLNEIRGFFSTLAPLELTHSELVLLINCQLIPTLTYRLMAHNFPTSVLESYDKAIWTELCANSRVSGLVSEKDRNIRRKEGGLNLNSLRVSVQKSVYHTALRHLNGEGPQRASFPINRCLRADSPNLLLDVFVDAAQSLGVRTHGWGPWNPCRVSDLRAGESVFVDCGGGTYHQGMVHTPGECEALVQFSDSILPIGDSSNFHFGLGEELGWGSRTSIAPPLPSPPPLTASPPQIPYGGFLKHADSQGHWVEIPVAPPIIKEDDLRHWGCLEAADALRAATPETIFIYLDGSKTSPMEVHHPAGPLASRPPDQEGPPAPPSAQVARGGRRPPPREGVALPPPPFQRPSREARSNQREQTHPDLLEDLESYGPARPPQARGKQGSAIVLVDGDLTMAITLSLPYPDSVDAEFWALLCLLRSLVDSEPRAILIFCDNLQVVTTLKGIREGKTPVSSTKTAAGTWQAVLRDFLQCHPMPDNHQVVWIKAHVGFQGNELADACAKWASFAYYPLPLQVPPRHSLQLRGNTTISRIPPSQLRHLVSRHAHGDLALSPSFDWFSKSSWFGVRPFKWCSGTMTAAGYSYFTDVNDYHCHICADGHPMDVASQVALCDRFREWQEKHIAAWPPPFRHEARLWWELASRVERRHFMMTLVPKSLYARFKGMEWPSLEAFKSSFCGALRFRRKVLNKLVGETANFVRDTPCHGPYLPRRPPLRRNKWGGPFGLFSTTSSVTTFVEPTYHPPPPYLRRSTEDLEATHKRKSTVLSTRRGTKPTTR